MEVKSLKNYWDTQLSRKVGAGEVVAVTRERGKYLIEIGYAEKTGKEGKTEWPPYQSTMTE